MPTLFGLGLALLALGCGPIRYSANVLSAARVVREAEAAGAPDLAPYEFYGAQVRLEKAREEAAEGQYQDAERFAGQARVLALRARRLARTRARAVRRGDP
ncbi:MAG: DUF4398 domain-containing protein [Sandaracinaceae bacterium]